MNKKNENMSLSEITADYTVLSEEIVDGYKIGVIRTHSGYTVRCRIPIHTPEEKKQLSESICQAMIRLVYPDLDLTKVERMEVQF